MKRLFTTLLILFSFAASAQTYKLLNVPGETGYLRGPGALRVDGILVLAGNDTLPVMTALKPYHALIGKGDSLYRWSPVQNRWIPIAGGGASVWGSITGTLSNQTDLQNALNQKQNKLFQGTTAQYFRGDLSLGTFSTDVLALTNPLYAAVNHTHNGLNPVGGDSGYVLMKNSATNWDYNWQPIETISPVSSVFGRTGAVIAQPGDYSAYYAPIDSITAHRQRMDSMGIYNKFPLRGSRGAVVGDRDTSYLDADFLTDVNFAIDFTKNFTAGVGVTHEELEDTAAAIRADMGTGTGTADTTLYFKNGGNYFAGNASLGNKNNSAVDIVTNNLPRVRITASGHFIAGNSVADNGADVQLNGTVSMDGTPGAMLYIDSSNLLHEITPPSGFTKPVMGYLNNKPVWREDSVGTGGGTSTVATLDDLTDVKITSPVNNDVLAYVDTAIAANKWKNKHSLTIDTTGAAPGKIGVWNGTKFILDNPSGVSSYTDEQAQDAVGATLSNDFVYNDGSNSITINEASAALTVTSGAATLDGTVSRTRYVTLSANTTLSYSGLVDGRTYTIMVTQDGTGGRTFTLPAGTKTNGTPTTTAGARNIYCFKTINGTVYCVIRLFS